MAELTDKPNRRYELDWLRVLVILNLIPYHVAWLMVAVPGFSNIDKQSSGNTILTIYFTFFRQWHMPLLFLIAGVSTCYALDFRSIREYVIERIKRLLVPLAFFVAVISPIGAYFFPDFPGTTEVKSIPDYFTRFWPGFLQRFPNPKGPPEWAHLWFVGYLFVMSVACLPLFLYLRNDIRKRSISHLAHLCDRWPIVFIPGILFAIVYATLRIHWPFTYYHALYNDLAYFFYNLIAFILGFLICLDGRFWKTIDRHFKVSLVFGGICTTVVFYMHFKMPAFSTPQYTVPYIVYSILFGFNTWLWVMGILGLARRFLPHSNRFLKYFSTASYPFFIMHLLPLIAVGNVVVQWRIGLIAEFGMLSLLGFGTTLLIYELLVRRTRVTRFLFGIKYRVTN